MQLAEVGKLLQIIKSFDNRKLEDSTAVAWKMQLDRNVPGASLDQATEVVLDWFATANPYFEVRHLIDGLKRVMRLTPFQIGVDVRSAKARGLIESGWDERYALPVEVAQRLAEARACDRDKAVGLTEVESGRWPTLKEIGVE